MNLIKLKAIALGLLLSAIGLSIAYGDSIKDVDQWRIDLINKTIEQYKKDNERDGSCTIDGTKVSINSIIFGKVANESGYGTHGAGAKYNNRGNMKRAAVEPLPKQVEQGKKTKLLDGGQYFLYDSIEDGIYDMIERNKRRGNGKCSIGFESSFMYLKGTKAERTEKNIKDVRMYLTNIKNTALSYEKDKHLYLVSNDDTIHQANIINGIDEPQEMNKGMGNEKLITKGTPKTKIKKVCKQVSTIKDDNSYIQTDTMLGQFIGWIRNLGKGTKVFVCRDIA